MGNQMRRCRYTLDHLPRRRQEHCVRKRLAWSPSSDSRIIGTATGVYAQFFPLVMIEIHEPQAVHRTRFR